MKASNNSLWSALVPLLLLACGEDPPCPAGSTKQAGVCVKGDPAQADDGDESIDGGTPDAGDADEGDDDTATPDAGCAPGSLVYVDMDGDGVGAGEGHEGCPGEGLVAATGDCSPENALVFPGAEEVCNGIDEDCDEEVDEGVSLLLYVDVDGDGHGDPSDLGEKVCAGQVVPGRVASHDDCDDDCAACSPDNTTETACDGKDENCDGTLDEGMTTPYFLDCDGDGYLPAEPRERGACSRPAHPDECALGRWFLAGEAADGTDCSDTSSQAHPGATYSSGELVSGTNGYDYNCDMAETPTGVRCLAAAGADCLAMQATAMAECFTMAVPACGVEASALRCVDNFGLHPHVWAAISKKSPCR